MDSGDREETRGQAMARSHRVAGDLDAPKA